MYVRSDSTSATLPIGNGLSIPAGHLPFGNGLHYVAMDYFRLRAKRVAELIRVSYGNSQASFAKVLDINPTTVSRWLATPPVKNIGEDTARRIEKVANLAPGSLVFPEGHLDLTERERRVLEAFRKGGEAEQALIERALGIHPTPPGRTIEKRPRLAP